MDDLYKILLTIKDDLPIVVKEFEAQDTIDTVIEWVKNNKKAINISMNDWIERIFIPSLNHKHDQFLPVGRLIDTNGTCHIIMFKLERKDVDIVNAKEDSKFINDMSFESLDKLLGWDWYENERTS